MAENFYQEACELVAQLLDVRGRLRENERDFLDERAAKLEQYGERTFMSKAQMDWLRGLAKKHYHDPRQLKMF